ncbi:DUF6090 family protein [Winogradskyella sp. MIT101101]|uniref:DUF6090 family protein n=1 Tax=Winogradskyella sp. MIT101101 TaxID=3098297 RepID=UPI00399BCACB
MSENKTSRYFKYAIGEIVLVVIGILIALQLNNWNQDRIFKQKMESYYLNLYEEIKTNETSTNLKIGVQEKLQKQLKVALQILSANDFSKRAELQVNLGAMATAWTGDFSLNVFNEFIAQDLLSKVEDKELKHLLTQLKKNLENMVSMDNYTVNQYTNLIEPFVVNTLNYSAIALPRYKVGLVEGSQPLDFESIYNSNKLWNVLTIKLETTNLNIRDLNRLKLNFQQLEAKLKKLNAKS